MERMDFRVRGMRGEEAEAVAGVIRTAFAAQGVATDPPASALRESGAGVAAILAAGGGAVAEADGGLVGAALWQEKEGGLYVSRVSVMPGWRGRGVARRLLAAAEAAARARGLGRIWLSTRLVLADNRAMFAACGFRETAQHAHPGYAVATFVDMEKTLRPG